MEFQFRPQMTACKYNGPVNLFTMYTCIFNDRNFAHIPPAMLEEMLKKIEKWQELPPARTAKPLPVPGGPSKKRRGGKRARAMKERFGASDMQKAANRVNFGVAEEEYGLDGEGLGTLGTSAGMAAASGAYGLKLYCDALQPTVW